MSYNKRTWATGNVVGAVDLNRIENGIADIDVDEIRGWGMESTQLFSEIVTTTVQQMGNLAVLSYTGNTFPDSMNIIFDGTEYTCSIQGGGDPEYWYGAPNPDDWSTYPFVLLYMNGQWTLITQTAGEYTVSAYVSSVEVSDAFKTAVNNAAPLPMLCVSGVTTYDEMIAAKNAKRLLYFWTENEGYGCYIIRTVDSPCNINPPTASVVANFDNNNVLVITEQ